MKTDDLIAALAAHPAPVQPARSMRALLWASGTGVLAALGLLAITLGFNPQLAAELSLPMFWVKLAFVLATVAIGYLIVLRLAQPGRKVGALAWSLGAPASLMWVLAALALLPAAPGERSSLLLGTSWLVCPIYIAAFSAPSFLLVLHSMRSLAPTRLRVAGAAAGLLSGAIGASVYQLYCPELAAPFIGVWYVLGMSIPAALGALIGPRALRW
jgi:hypothetical protein